MKQKINILIISVVAVLMVIIGFVFAINYRKTTIKYFNDSGYIISNSYENDSDNASKIFFDKDTSYKDNKNDTYYFTNSGGEKVSVKKDSFVHYSNGSIMSLTKGVGIDLNFIDSKIISYYNIFEGSILKKNGELYEINNLDKVITFSKLMFKLSNNKYLIAAPNIVISFSDDQTVNMNNYVELEYISENVIRLYNDQVNYQTIASDLYIIVDDIKIDLEYKTISKNDVKYLTMADMVINSDDNIEVLPLPEEIIIPDKDNNENSTTNNNQNNNNVDSNLQEGLDNLIGSLPSDNEQIDTENQYVQPKFKVDNIDIKTLGFENLRIIFEDESSVLYGDRTVEILENSTGRVVQKFEDWEEGNPEFVINSYFSLKPNTEYTINVVGQYKIEETVYDRTFVSKIFRTLDLGLEIKEDYVTSDSLSFAVYRNSSSIVNGFTYNIVDKDGNIIVDDTSVKYGDVDTEVLIFSEENKFKPNTDYVLTIKNIEYGNDVFLTVSYEALKLTHKTKTLKENPFRLSENNNIDLNSVIDSRNNLITFSIDGINDVYGGIREYIYNIYDSNNGELKQTITKNNSNGVAIDINKLNANNVYFNVGINFEDNEKTIVYSSNNSTPISISGISYPKVVQYKEAINNNDYETLKGEILLDDESDYIQMNSVSYYRVVLKEKVNDILNNNQHYVEANTRIIEYRKEESTYALPIYFDGLKPSTDYITYVYLIQGEKEIYLGYAEAKTAEPQPIYLTITDDTAEGTTLFDFNIQKDVEKENISNSKVRNLVLDLYKCSKDECEKLEGYFTTIPEHADSLELDNMMIGNGIVFVNSSDFNFEIDNYESEYSYKVVVTGVSSDYEIPIIINNTEKNEYDIEFNDIVPPLNLNIVEILKSNSSELSGNNSGAEVKDNTIVGLNFEVSTYQTPMGDMVNNMDYNIYEGLCKNISEESEKKISGTIEFDKNEKIFFIPIDTDSRTTALKRGKNYCIEYRGTYINDDDQFVLMNVQSKDFMAKKQRVEIDGYIKEYNGENLTFSLNIIDPDKAMMPYEENYISLVNSATGEVVEPKSFPTESVSGDYQYNVDNGGSYVLKITENIGYDETFDDTIISNEEYEKQGEKELKIYDVKLDHVVTFNQFEVSIDSTNVGYVTIEISNIDKEYLDRISGLMINNKIVYLKLSDDEDKLFARINLSDIEKKGYGTINNGILNFEQIKLVYDSGKIVDYNGVNNQIFIKSKTGNLYYDSDSKKFISSPHNIFNTSDVKDLISENIKFISSDQNSSIGQILKDSTGVTRFVHFNEATSIDVETDKDIPVTEILSTSGITTKYTSTGALVSFDITTGEKEGMNLIVELNSDKELLETASIKYSNDKWNGQLFESNKYIKSISLDNDTITIEFKNITDGKYNYSLKFKSDNSDFEEFTYNDDTQNNNKNISVTSLKNLKITYKSVEVEKSGWKFSADYSDLSFDRKMKINFNVDVNQYQLLDTESIGYKIIAKNTTNNNEIELINGQTIQEINEVQYSLSNNEKLPAGSYNIILRPVIKSIELSDIELNNVSLNEKLNITSSEPNIKIISSGEPKFDITINDSDGKLSACSNRTGLPTSNLMEYVDDISKTYFESSNNNKKVVYFELYSLHEDGTEIYRGYSPIPFAKHGSTLNLKNYFYDKKLASGVYRVKLKYCTVDNTEQYSEIIDDFDIFNAANLNVQLIDMGDSYILMFDNPDETLKESIGIIEYQFTTENSKITRRLDNTNNAVNNDDNFSFNNIPSLNGTISFLGLSTGGTNTALIKSLTVNFYKVENGEEKLIAQWSK